MKQRLIITGGHGFIGTSLAIAAIKSNDFCICIIDRNPASTAISRNPKFAPYVNLFSGDFNAFASGDSNCFIHSELKDINCHDFFPSSDLIVHLAGNTGVQQSISSPTTDLSENINNTISILESIRQLDEKPKLIFSSSVAPLAGNTTFPLHYSLPYKPLSPYGASKSAVESYLSAYSSSFGVPYQIFRFSNVYGPGSLHKGSVIARMIKDGLYKQRITIFGDGEQTRDFIYIDDLVAMLIWSFRTNFGRPIHLCTGLPTTVLSVAELIQKIIKHQAHISVSINHKSELPGDARVNYSIDDVFDMDTCPQMRKISRTSLEDTFSFFYKHPRNSPGIV